jgi:hypothetical protein
MPVMGGTADRKEPRCVGCLSRGWLAAAVAGRLPWLAGRGLAGLGTRECCVAKPGAGASVSAVRWRFAL